MIWLLPMLILFKLRLLDNWKAKEAVLTFFFANQSQSTFQKSCDEFILSALPLILRTEAVRKIEEHIRNNDRVIVVSASGYNWVAGWCKSMNIELIATNLESKNGVMTGKLDSINCNDEEKVRRITGYLNLEDYKPIYAYGNSSGDIPMLALADFPFYQKF